MPRKVITRRWVGTNTDDDARVLAIKDFLITGDRRAAIDAIRASDTPSAGILILWQNDKLEEFWREHRAEILRQARRRRVRLPHGLIYDRFKNGAFSSSKQDPFDDHVEDGAASARIAARLAAVLS